MEIIWEQKYTRGSTFKCDSWLSWRRVQSLQAPNRVRTFFPNLEVFEWTYICITTISAASLNFIKLVILDLTGDKIRSIDCNFFDNLLVIEIILVSGNKLLFVGQNIVIRRPHITYADFTNNPCMTGYSPTQSTSLYFSKPFLNTNFNRLKEV